MTTKHFNELTEDEAERLALLIEECSEVQSTACKILRHGYSNLYRNREDLTLELGDLLHVISRLVRNGDVEQVGVDAAVADKERRIVKYLHHQSSLPRIHK